MSLKLLLCLPLLVAMSSAYAADVPRNYTVCAGEGQTCGFTGSRKVAYGAGGKFAYGIYQGSVACKLENFGGVDPNPNRPNKTCSYAKRQIDMSDPAPKLRGVSLAGAEFATDPWGNGALPGTYGVDYTYPTASEVSYFLGKRMNTVRLPFRWERLQPALNAAFDAAELARLDGFVRNATAQGATVLLDPHNYARWHTSLVGSSSLPNSAFADFWSRLAAQYKSNANVVFGLMNEPHDMATEAWLSAANASIAAIRAAGANNLVLVPGNGWTGAASWSLNWYGSPNADVMLGIVDPHNRYAYEVHQYLDSDSSGTSSQCVSTTIGVERLAGFTAWLRSHAKRGFLGEFAGADNATCSTAINQMMAHLGANRDVWIGWTWWAAGPWWGDYMFSLEPRSNGADAPQMSWLTPFLP